MLPMLYQGGEENALLLQKQNYGSQKVLYRPEGQTDLSFSLKSGQDLAFLSLQHGIFSQEAEKDECFYSTLGSCNTHLS